jgi:hypothetical protein
MRISTERIRQYASDPRMCNVSDELRSIAAELLAIREAQSVPVATLDIQRSREDKPFLLIDNAAARELPDDTYLLYTAPPAPVVPNKIKDHKFNSGENADEYYTGYQLGWNECREEMLGNSEK